MEILDVPKEEYSKFAASPFSKYDTADFIELNKHKADDVKYYIFENSKKRFGLVSGIKDGVMKCPFSASFGIFSEISKNNKMQHYHDAVSALVKESGRIKLKGIEISAPAVFYSPAHITKFQNALVNNGFKISCYDINFEYYTKNFDENYLAGIQRNARKNYNAALRNGLIFEKTDDIESVYEIISRNRKFRGFPLHMSLEDVINTSKIIKSDYFIVFDKNGAGAASALIQHLRTGLVRVVYWGNTPESEDVRPINFLSYNIFKYYKEKGIELIDIGTSTVEGVPNCGLCDFKESIGCSCSPKINWTLKLR